VDHGGRRHGERADLGAIHPGLVEKAPVIAYQHSTHVYRECAPSHYNANPFAILWAKDLTGALQNYVECIVGGLMASAGYIVAMPDYAGFGASGAMHPYVHLSLGRSVEGIVALALAHGTANGNVSPTGYSEGGYATMAGAKALQLSTVVSPPSRTGCPSTSRTSWSVPTTAVWAALLGSSTAATPAPRSAPWYLRPRQHPGICSRARTLTTSMIRTATPARCTSSSWRAMPGTAGSRPACSSSSIARRRTTSRTTMR
jgi:hypothetical protein